MIANGHAGLVLLGCNSLDALPNAQRIVRMAQRKLPQAETQTTQQQEAQAEVVTRKTLGQGAGTHLDCVSILIAMKKIFKTSDKVYMALFVPLTVATFIGNYFTPLSVFTIALGFGYIGWRVGRA